MKKLKNILLMSITSLFIFTQTVRAEPGFNESHANKIKTNMIAPITAWFMGIVGAVVILVCLMQFFKWALKDEEEREQKSYWKSIKPIIIGAIIVESISTILLIFSIT